MRGNSGVMEWWSDGMMGDWNTAPNFVAGNQNQNLSQLPLCFQRAGRQNVFAPESRVNPHPIRLFTPILPNSITPLLHRSITPTLHYSHSLPSC